MKTSRHTLTLGQVFQQQARGTRLGPGVWVDAEGALHFSIPELMAAMGVPETPENIEVLTDIVTKFLREKGHDEVVIQELRPD